LQLKLSSIDWLLNVVGSSSQALDKLCREWENAELGILPYRDTGTCVVKVEEALSQSLDDAVVMLQSMAFSPYKKPFEDKLAKWDTQLNLVRVHMLVA
jgi:dynein heavy chain